MRKNKKLDRKLFFTDIRARRYGWIERKHIEDAIKYTNSNAAAARYLNVTLATYKKNAQKYLDDKSGKDLYEIHLNQSGKGMPKINYSWGDNLTNQEIIDGAYPAGAKAHEIQKILVFNGHLPDECNNCGYNDRRPLDEKLPLVLNYIDGDPLNRKLENLEQLCYNCLFFFGMDFMKFRRYNQTKTNQFQVNEIISRV